MSENEFHRIEDLIEDVRLGRMVILVDDEDRENEGDLILAADHVSPEAINFMVREARGLVCLSLTSSQVERLRLPLMVEEDSNLTPNKTAFTVSIEAAHGVSTGISAQDRAHTVRVASRPNAQATDLHRPGHIFPIRAQDGGVLRRAGHTEASVDLARLAGLNPAAVICEVMKEDGSMARVPDLRDFARRHQIKIGSIVDLIQYRLGREVLVEEQELPVLPDIFSGFKVRVFRSRIDHHEHLVLQKGDIHADTPTLVRMQVENHTRDILSSLKNHQSVSSKALQRIEEEGSGIFVLLRAINRSQNLASQLKSLAQGPTHVEYDDKDYGIGAQILRALGASKIRLISSRQIGRTSGAHKDQKIGLRAFNLEIVETLSLDGQESEIADEDRSSHLTLQ